MKLSIYPSLEEAIYLHQILISKYGGTPGILDKGLLESALARPKSGYYKSLTEQAAALLQSLCINHPFIDGNKRLAVALAAVFLRLNGIKIKIEMNEGVEFIQNQIIINRVSLDKISAWIERQVV